MNYSKPPKLECLQQILTASAPKGSLESPITWDRKILGKRLKDLQWVNENQWESIETPARQLDNWNLWDSAFGVAETSVSENKDVMWKPDGKRRFDVSLTCRLTCVAWRILTRRLSSYRRVATVLLTTWRLRPPSPSARSPDAVYRASKITGARTILTTRQPKGNLQTRQPTRETRETTRETTNATYNVLQRVL